MEKQNSDEKKKSEFQVPNLERALQILEYLIQFPEGKGISDLAKELAFPKNSVFRILNTLENYSYIQRDALKKYTLTNKMFAISYDRADRKNLIECAVESMRRLRDDVKETVVLSILAENECVVLDQVPGVHPFRFVVESGAKQELHTSAPAKSILAFIKKKDCDNILDNIEFIKRTQSTICSKAAYKKELKAVQKSFYATDQGEALEGVFCVASPILNDKNIAIAAITVTGPRSRVASSALENVIDATKKAAKEISAKLGYTETSQ